MTGPEADKAQSAGNGAAKEARALIAAEASEVKPYVYACTFNGYDILRQDKETIISKVNDANINFELDVVHPEGKAPQAPELHCFIEVKDKCLGKMEEKTFKPTAQSTVSPTRTQYVYTGTWKRDLSPEIGKNQKPWFVLPDTGEVVNTTLQPVRASIDQPLISGQEGSNPFNSVFAKGFNLAVNIPVIGGTLSVSLPFDRYLPRINADPTGYVAITFMSG